MTMSEVRFISGVRLNTTKSLRELADTVSEEYICINIGCHSLELGEHAVERFVSVAEDTEADMLYSDHWEIVADAEGRPVRRKHPLIVCQKGALRNDFDFGDLLFFRAPSFCKAVEAMDDEYEFAAL